MCFFCSRFIFLIFQFNDTALHSFTIDRLPKTLSFNDDKIIDQKNNVIEWINEHLNDYHIKVCDDDRLITTYVINSRIFLLFVSDSNIDTKTTTTATATTTTNICLVYNGNGKQ